MAHKTETAAKTLSLPVIVVGPVDMSRLIRELEVIDESLLQQGLRDKEHELTLPKTSKMMEQIISANQLDLQKETDRQKLKDFLTHTQNQAPVMHMSFSSDPSPAFLEKLLAWLRREIHPLVLVTIGLQPNIAAGCIVRTTNKYFDMSLRKDLLSKSDVLMSKIASSAAPAPAAPVEQAA